MKRNNKYTREYLQKHYHLNESELFDDNDFINEDDEPGEGSDESVSSEIDDSHIKIDALKISMKIIKLMDLANIEDLITVSTKVSAFLKNYTPGADIEEILGLKDKDEDDDDITVEDNDEGSEDESSDNDETTDENDLTLDDLDDFTIEDEDEDKKEDDKNDEEDASEGSSEVPDQFII